MEVFVEAVKAPFIRRGGHLSDDDWDGVLDTSDTCPDTVADEVVDASGCSRAQFCARFPVATGSDRSKCMFADFNNDDVGFPLARDCKVERVGATNRCVPQ